MQPLPRVLTVLIASACKCAMQACRRGLQRRMFGVWLLIRRANLPLLFCLLSAPPRFFLRLCVEALWETWLNIHTEQRGEGRGEQTLRLVWSWRKRLKCKLKATIKQIQQEMRKKVRGKGMRGCHLWWVAPVNNRSAHDRKKQRTEMGKRKDQPSPLFHLEAPW